jgi:hypothetical protein
VIAAAAESWKVVLAGALLAAVVLAWRGRAPRTALGRARATSLILVAVCLYGLGLLAAFGDQRSLATFVYAAGIGVCALALWLSRGSDPGEGPGGGDSGDEQPPPDSGGAPAFDWESFERQFRDYARRSDGRDRASSSKR